MVPSALELDIKIFQRTSMNNSMPTNLMTQMKWTIYDGSRFKWMYELNGYIFCQNTVKFVLFKSVHFIAFKLYLNTVHFLMIKTNR